MDRQVMEAKQNLWRKLESRNGFCNHLPHFIKLQKAVPRFEGGLLLW